MASTSSADATSPKLTLKLLVDTKQQRVLYAEASKDVVDVLFSFLTLPVGTVVKMLSTDKISMAGSVGNLYGSVENLDATYIRSPEAKDALLATPGGGDLLLLMLPQAAATTAAPRPAADLPVQSLSYRGLPQARDQGARCALPGMRLRDGVQVEPCRADEQ